MQIKTNNVPRHIIYGFELPENQREEFDYLSDDEYADAEFFKYKGNYYGIGEFMRCESELKQQGWYGYRSDSFFSGVVIKLSSDGDSVIVGQYFA